MDIDRLRERVRRKLGEQRLLVLSLLRLREQLHGSLFVRYGECGKEACCCHHGQKHGPYYVLSTRSAGRGGFSYLAGRQVTEARDLVGRYRQFRSGLRRLKKVNGELVELLRRYQEAVAKLGGKRLGVAARAS